MHWQQKNTKFPVQSNEIFKVNLINHDAFFLQKSMEEKIEIICEKMNGSASDPGKRRFYSGRFSKHQEEWTKCCELKVQNISSRLHLAYFIMTT